MTKLRKLWVLALVLVLCTICLMGCQSGQNEQDNTQNPSENNVTEEGTQTESTEVDVTESESTEEDTTVKLEPYDATRENPLTGLIDMTVEAKDKRPVAVMVNNTTKGFPQYGIEEADIIFEIPVEGGLTRFMVMYADYTQVPNVCSVRSVRKYFPAISEGFDAIFINLGRNEVIIPYLESLNLTRYEGLFNEGGLFTDDKERKKAGYSLEYTHIFQGPELAARLKKDKARVDIEDDKKGNAFNFYPYGEEVALTGTSCVKAKIDFGAVTATLKYDAATQKYYKEYNGKAQIDGSTGNQLSFTNVFVLETKIKADANGIHRDVNWKGGKGYYISNGIIQNITWSKASEEDPILLFDENGNELTINRGKSYFAINYIGEAKFE